MKEILINLSRQTLELRENGRVLKRYAVSAAKNGAGEQNGSQCTPRGRHVIRARIGAGQPHNAVFVARRPTGEIYSSALRAQHPGRDWILTRILWLGGLEPGRNRYREVSTMPRYVYLHGTPDETELGKPGSHGCVRMRNADIVELFEQVQAGTPVEIVE